MKQKLDDNKERELILLRAAYQLLKKQDKSFYVLNLLEQSTVWDGTDCDGYCLMEELQYLLEDNNVDPDFTEEVE